MSTIINNKPFSTPSNINLKEGLLRFGKVQTANNFGTLDYGIYVNASGQLVFSSLGTGTILGGSGGGTSIPSLEQIFGGDQTMTITGTTFTFLDAGTGSNNVLTVTASTTMSGNLININNSGTGKDINGTSNTWSITKLGAAVLTNIDTPLITSSAALTIAVAGSGALTLGTGSNTITAAVATTFSSTVALSGATTQTNSTLILTSNSNTVAPLIVTDNTATSYGTAVSEGLAVIRSTSLTTGSLLKLQATQANLTSGLYIDCYDVTGSARVFSVAKYGATVIGGSAYATAALTVTSGDLVISAGKILHTAAGATTTGGFLGTYVGITTGYGMLLSHTTSAIISGGSVLRLSSTGTNTSTTTGVLLDMADASVAGTKILGTFGTTTGIGMSLVTAVTTGTALSLTNGSGAITTNGQMLLVTANSASTSTGVIRVSCAGLTSGTALSVTGGGANVTSAGTVASILMGAATDGSGILTSTTGAYIGTVGLLAVTANSATTGTIVNISGTGLTSGMGALITGGGANTLTAGIALSVAMGAATVGAGIKVLTSGAYTDVASAVVNITAASATSGNVLGVLTPSSKAFVVGRVYATPAFQVDCSTGTQIAGLKVTGAVTAGTVALIAIDSGAAAGISLDAKGAGNISLGGVSTGVIAIGRTTSATILGGVINATIATQNGTPTAANMFGGLITHTSTTGAGTLTLPTGTQMDSAISGVANGDSQWTCYANIGNQTVTITANTGFTITGTAAVPAGKNAQIYSVRTGVNTWVGNITLSS